jgi:5'-3' exoribonuclease 1
MKKYNKKDFIFPKESFNERDTIDDFLIDANCLIHPICLKISKENIPIIDNNILENKMIEAVTTYIDQLIVYVNPNKFVYLAIDGVAPVAKIKQQRYRRFKSVADETLWNNIKKKYNKPITKLWNNNAITPGTKFMQKLHLHLLNWCNNHNKNIIYSSYLIPSEGEHKLLQYIRKNNNFENTYVIYGLDADLIFLSLTTNHNKIYLLRESNQINNKNSEILNFVNIKIMKELIFNTINMYYQTKYGNIRNIELTPKNIIYDFIFICYFLGNDFLPHIPSLNIYQNGLECLILNYIDALYEGNREILNSKSVNYLINPPNKFNISILKKLMEKISLQEEKLLKYNNTQLEKHKMQQNIHFVNNKLTNDNEYEKEVFKIENLKFKINNPVRLGCNSYQEMRLRYYKYYWNIEENEIEEFSKNLVKHYLYGLKWITVYYFDQCPSWNWYFPFDNPPFITDIYKYMDETKLNKIKFELGKPIRPFLQLLLVLPIQSQYLLPDIFAKYIYQINSAYPKFFSQDFLNKFKYWMAQPILPPLNLSLVKQFYLRYKKILSEEELESNQVFDLPIIKNNIN